MPKTCALLRSLTFAEFLERRTVATVPDASAPQSTARPSAIGSPAQSRQLPQPLREDCGNQFVIFPLRLRSG
ncbi:MAG: hypothetical protein ACYCSN_17175, partial [Acidobacteriaceae bacterium]